MAGRHGCAIALALLCATGASAQDIFWDIEKVEFRTTHVRIARPGVNHTFELAPAERFRLLREVKRNIEKQAGITARMLISETAGEPATFSTSEMDRNTLTINFEMLKLMGEDPDAIAVVLAHEYAHMMLKHSASRSDRIQGQKTAIKLFGLLGSAVAAANTGIELAAEERAADDKGTELVAAAGYSPVAGLKLWEKMAAAQKPAPEPEFGPRGSPDPASSGGSFNWRTRVIDVEIHPGIMERIGRLRTLAAKYGPAVARPAAAPIPPPPVALADLNAAEERAGKDPNDAQAWRMVASHYSALGDAPAARRVYTHLVKLEPANIDGLETLGALHARLGEKDRAGWVWEQLLKLDPKRADDFFSAHILP
jgi:hypothetical protein